MEIDKKIILRLIQVLEDLKKSLKGIEIDTKDESAEEEIEISGTVVKSPIVGTAYLAPEPGGKKFIDLGKKIKKGDTIMIVEAMKTMNHVPSTSDGIVKEISVEDGQPVEFGQKLIILE
jgi:acetyl-CoA carboxylase biotin carboxyl carrier protein